MVEAFVFAYRCAACKHMLLCMLGVVCEAIGDDLEGKFAETKPHKVAIAHPADGRKRANDTYRHYVMRAVHKKRRGANGKRNLQGDGYHPSRHHAWVHKEVGSYFAACSHAFSAAIPPRRPPCRSGTLAVTSAVARCRRRIRRNASVPRNAHMPQRAKS